MATTSSTATKETGILIQYEHLYVVKKLLGSRFHVARLVAFLPAGCATDRMTVPMEKMRRRLSVKVGKSESRIA